MERRLFNIVSLSRGAISNRGAYLKLGANLSIYLVSKNIFHLDFEGTCIVILRVVKIVVKSGVRSKGGESKVIASG